MLFLGNSLRWFGELEDAFQNALEKCGGILYAIPTALHLLILQEEKAAQMLKDLTRIQVVRHLDSFRNQKAGKWLVEAHGSYVGPDAASCSPGCTHVETDTSSSSGYRVVCEKARHFNEKEEVAGFKARGH
jgi:hypothetical protein